MRYVSRISAHITLAGIGSKAFEFMVESECCSATMEVETVERETKGSGSDSKAWYGASFVS